MNVSTKMMLGLLLFSGSLCAKIGRSSEEVAFIDAARDGKMEIIDRLFDCVKTQRTYDKALREAARNGNRELFCKIAPRASQRGRRKALKSLKRHGRRICCYKHVVQVKA